MNIKDNLDNITNKISTITDRTVKIVGVTKYSEVTQIIEAINAGRIDFKADHFVGLKVVLAGQHEGDFL